MPSFRGFGVFRGSLFFGDKSQYVFAATHKTIQQQTMRVLQT
jgi:hypothetical protein